MLAWPEAKSKACAGKTAQKEGASRSFGIPRAAARG